MNETVLREPLASVWQGRDVFAEIGRLQGMVVRDKEGRRTFRCEIGGDFYYVKHHRGVGWLEIFKNLVQLRLPVVDASNEWLAINRLKTLGIDTLEAVGYGRRGWNPASRESFLVTRELSNTVSLEDIAAQWPARPPAAGFRRAVIRRVAEIARCMHRHGINHRDLYICHFLLDVSAGAPGGSPAAVNPRFYVVDLHRAQMRQQVPARWLVKDLASLYFSALDIGLSARDLLRFLRIYFDRPLASVIGENGRLLRAVEKRACKLYWRDFNRKPVLPLPAP